MILDKLNGKIRTCYCGEFTKELVGKEVTAMGWVAKRRDFGSLIFVDLRDRTGVVQVVFNKETFAKDFSKVEALRNEFVVVIEGKLTERDPQNINGNITTGKWEIKAEDLGILGVSQPLPFAIDDNAPSDFSRLKHRYLDLRREPLQKNILLRNEIYKSTRRYLEENSFIEIETPFLGKSTPEGARDYLVPSRTFPNKFFALPQSPQLYKQMLMISGFDRYYQIARCFRDEDLRADRQPEFTQIDMEVSFVDKEQSIMEIMEGLVKRVFKDTKGIEFKKPFLQLSYADAMDRFGSDKPDLRFGLEIVNISDIAGDCQLNVFKDICSSGGSVRLINGKGMCDKLPRRDLEKLVDFVKELGAPGMSYITISDNTPKSPLLKYFSDAQLKQVFDRSDAKNNDVLFLVADKDNELVQTTLGKLRLHLAEKFKMINENEYYPLWVKDFPLFEYSKEEKRYVAKHHPFTSPKDEDLPLLETNPGKMRAKAYDIVINGYEVGGGSIRIYDSAVQQKMFKALGFTDERIETSFGFFVNAFKYGAPPHGGLAIGLDRLTMLLANTKDIKSVIAFPKIQTAFDVLTEAPDFVENKQIDELYLKLVKPEKDANK